MFSACSLRISVPLGINVVYLSEIESENLVHFGR